MIRSLALSAAAFFGLTAAALACPTYTMTGQSHNVTGPQLLASQQWNVVAGGENNLRNCPQIGIQRTGYFITPPDFSFYMSQMEGYNLNVSVQGQCDTTLLLNDPTTQWHFDDDAGGSLQPRIVLDGPANGRLDAWVGTYSGEYCNAQIMLQTAQAFAPQPQPQPVPVPQPPVAAACPSWQTPGPQIPVSGPGNTGALTYNANASGPIRAADCAETGVTAGFYVTQAPTFSLPLSNMDGYTLRLSADGGTCDTALLVNLPDTTWMNNDDFNGLQPQIDISGLSSGRLDVWVGRWANEQTCPAQFTIQTIATGGQGGGVVDPVVGGGVPACPTWAVAGQQLMVSGPTGTSGFNYRTTAGGDSVVGDCPELGLPYSGHVTSQPQYSLMLDSMAGYDLELTVQGDGGCDTVLLANLPNTDWEYNDDGAGNLQPILTISGLESGRLDVWVGTWGSNRNCAASFGYRTIPVGGGAPQPQPVPLPQPQPQANACPDLSQMGQTVNLTGDQLYSPQAYQTQASGSTQIADSCPQITYADFGSGYFTQAPQYTFNLTGMDRYRLVADVDSQCDAAMLINSANGTWYFNDDGNGNLDPRIELNTNADLNGRIDVWVGTWNNSPCPATLNLETWLR